MGIRGQIESFKFQVSCFEFRVFKFTQFKFPDVELDVPFGIRVDAAQVSAAGRG